MYLYGNFTDNNSRKRPLDEGIYECMNVHKLWCALIGMYLKGDEGPQMKKPSISGGQSINAQAIAQAAIAK